MPSLAWYAKRLLAMSPAEVLWRTRCAARDAVDRHRYRRRTRWVEHNICSNGQELRGGFTAWLGEEGAGTGGQGCDEQNAGAAGLLRRADSIAAGRLSFFDLVDHDLGDPIDWNRDPKHRHKAALIYAPLVDYRDFELAGDCKFVWEPNRHHQLVVLGRAYRASGDRTYASRVVQFLESWLDRCPHAEGMNWRSALELGIRLINWVWTVDLIQPADVMTLEFKRRLWRSVYLHLWEIERNYSRGSSAANHLIGEAAGAFIASRYFNELPKSAEWAEQARDILQAAILEQTHTDGGGREQALGYHLFILQFFLLAGLVARRTGRDFEPAYWERLSAMLHFLGALTEGGQELPMFGDNDDGYVLDLDENPRDPRPWLAVGAALFQDPQLKVWAGGSTMAVAGLLGRDFESRYERMTTACTSRKLISRAWPDAGLYLLQCGEAGSANRISATFDCGPLGFRSIAAHGHADALSITLRAFGRDILVDPGTYDYFTYPAWRSYFRSTRAHNTIAVDGRDQSEMRGPFMWGRRAAAACRAWTPGEDGGLVTGEHDGYARLSDPVIHRRTVALDGAGRTLRIEDELLGDGKHEYAFYLHFSEHCELTRRGESEFDVVVAGGRLRLRVDPRLAVETSRGLIDPIAGWVSRGYHRKTPTFTLIGCCSAAGRVKLETLIEIGQALADGVPDDPIEH